MDTFSSLARCGRNHQRSLFGACTCTRVYIDSAELDEQSERGISKLSAEKGKCEKRIEVNDMRRSSA